MNALQEAPPRIQQPLAADVASECDLTDDARALLTPQIKAGAYLALLARENLWTDALRFAPYALERRAAIWWASLCVWQFYRPAPKPPVDRCFRAVTAWLNEPSEANRREAHAAAYAAELTTPAAHLALAAFFEHGSISPVGQPPVPAQPRHMPQSLAAAITLAVKLAPRDVRAARQNDYIRLALEVMAGRWPCPSSPQE